MRLLYRSCLIILLLLSYISFAEENTNSKMDTSFVPPSFNPVTSNTKLLPTSAFYNQLDEQKILENYDNIFIILHFWASWHMGSQNELLALNQLQKDFRKKPLLVIAISEDFKGTKNIDEYFTKHQIDYLDIYTDKKNKIYKSLGVSHLPISYLIDSNGKVIAQSTEGKVTDWSDESLVSFLEEKTSKYQLLPPEFKKTRDKYEPPKEMATKDQKGTQKNDKSKTVKQKIFIN